METLRNMTLREIYLSWVNDFITPAGFASYYGIEEPDAFKLINLSILFGKID